MNTIRVKFNKVGLAIYFSHLDLQRVMMRALKMSGLPVWYSMGYNPHIYMTFPLPLSLGQESVCESFDFRLTEEKSEEEILNALADKLPRGIELTAVGLPTYEAKDIRYAKYEINLYGDDEVLQGCINDFIRSASINVTKTSKKKTEEINLKDFITDFCAGKPVDGKVSFTAIFSAGQTNNINPALLVGYFAEKYGIDANSADIKRLNIFGENISVLQ